MFGLLDALKLGAGFLFGIAIYGAYDKLFDDPAVAREARSGYVLQAEKVAAEQTAAELLRQRNAATQALEEHRKRLAAAELLDEQKSAEREQEILAYEIRLSQANRRCLLDRDDLDFLRNAGEPPG